MTETSERIPLADVHLALAQLTVGRIMLSLSLSCSLRGFSLGVARPIEHMLEEVSFGGVDLLNSMKRDLIRGAHAGGFQ